MCLRFRHLLCGSKRDVAAALQTSTGAAAANSSRSSSSTKTPHAPANVGTEAERAVAVVRPTIGESTHISYITIASGEEHEYEEEEKLCDDDRPSPLLEPENDATSNNDGTVCVCPISRALLSLLKEEDTITLSSSRGGAVCYAVESLYRYVRSKSIDEGPDAELLCPVSRVPIDESDLQSLEEKAKAIGLYDLRAASHSEEGSHDAEKTRQRRRSDADTCSTLETLLGEVITQVRI